MREEKFFRKSILKMACSIVLVEMRGRLCPGLYSRDARQGFDPLDIGVVATRMPSACQ